MIAYCIELWTIAPHVGMHFVHLLTFIIEMCCAQMSLKMTFSQCFGFDLIFVIIPQPMNVHPNFLPYLLTFYLPPVIRTDILNRSFHLSCSFFLMYFVLQSEHTPCVAHM